MTKLEPFLSKDEIHGQVSDLAARISNDYRNKDLVLIGVLKGSFIFLSDLVRLLTIAVEIDFIGASSYGGDSQSSGQIRLTKPLQIDIRNKCVLIIEDIIDTGFTLAFLIDYVKSFEPDDLKVCTLLDKRERRSVDAGIDYAGSVVEEGFLVGYGLDFAEKYRNLPDLYCLKF